MTDSLPPLREALAAYGLLANKAFGQHFLLDLNITRKIARLADLRAEDTVIEVGPGPGGLTRALLETGVRVVAIEKDSRFVPLLDDLASAFPDRLSIVQADALKIDQRTLIAPADSAHVVSNLPYNVGTPLLIGWLTGPFRPRSLTLMFQKEVAQRIVAAVDSEAYGRLAVIAQAICEAKLIMDLPARAFTPPPKVDSAVVRLVPRDNPPSAAILKALEKVTAAAFGQRRKMLRSSLKPLGGAALCERAGIEPDARAEVVDVAGFLRLAESLA